MLIHVTADDIAKGQRYRHCECPVALAIARQTGQRCRVSATRIENPDGGRMVAPLEVAEFVKAFDRAGPAEVQPFEFELPDCFIGPVESGNATRG